MGLDMADERTLEEQNETEVTETTEEVEEVEETVTEEEESEETVATLKAQLQKEREEKENYKKGLLEVKRKDRKIDSTPKDDVSEQVKSVMYRENERTALKAVTDSESEYFIEDCVDEASWREIVQFVPRNVDKSSVRSIHRSLRAAVAAWKEDKGIKPKKARGPESELATTGGKGSESEPATTKKGRTFLKQEEGVKSWFK